MIDLFDVPWQELDLEAVTRFIGDAGEEGITWEAKADDERGALRPASIRKAACGLANTLGGYIIIGATWAPDERKWNLPGITPRDGEPELWIGKAIRGLSPEPRHEVKSWAGTDGTLVAVVWVEPVAQAPCMTAEGRIYERVSGATVPVQDAVVLARLFDRGAAARQRAERFADRGAINAINSSTWLGGGRSVGLAVSIAPISRETDDITSRLFVPTFRVALTNAVWDFFGRSRQPKDMEVRPEQDAYMVFGHFADGADDGVRSSWMLRAAWDGTVTAAATFDPSAAAMLSGFDDVLMPGWRTIVPLAERLGGYGPAHLTYATIVAQSVSDNGVPLPGAPVPPHETLYRRLPSKTLVRRVVPLRDPEPDDVGSIQREMQRAAGIESLEREEPGG